MPNSFDTGEHSLNTNRRISPRLAEVLTDRQGAFPVWVRAPKSGVEFYTGFSRAKLYEAASKGYIRSVSIREPGQVKGTRLFCEMSSIAYDSENRQTAGMWDTPVTVKRNAFIHKSLSCWSCNLCVGCQHGCSFCSVPDTSTNKLRHLLSVYGVDDPVATWGRYLFLRPWDEPKFLMSIAKAEATPANDLNTDGNRAIIFCSTTDPYQTVHHRDPRVRKMLQAHASLAVRRALELIRDHSTLNVRILTRSPRALQDLELFKSFGPRLLLGASIPTLDNRLARAYESQAPAPTQRLAMLRTARTAGVNVYAAIAPVFPEADDDDMRKTFAAVAGVAPETLFFEPINIRLGNVGRMVNQAAKSGVRLHTEVFRTPTTWSEYALKCLRQAEMVARETGLSDRLHLWPDPDLGGRKIIAMQSDPAGYVQWLQTCWNRISEWPCA